MMPALGVFHGDDEVGQLLQQQDGRLAFEYAATWLASERAFSISSSVPLDKGINTARAAHAFFANLLPEGQVRQSIARRLGVSSGNDFALLERLGGECAGALVILPAGQAPSPTSGVYQPLEAATVAQMARRYDVLAEATARGAARLSLAGAQDKLPVKRADDGTLWLPTGGAPSTHILKVPSRDFKHLPANEVLITRLGHQLGLATVDSALVAFEEVEVALVRRYDRLVQPDGEIERLHQEDLCQALGLMPGTKYEEEGGPRFADAMEVVRRWSVEPLPDAQRLLRWLIFGLLVGNADGHGKNLSLLYAGQARSPRLAPLYDLVCTRAYPRIDRSLAMSVGGKRDPGQVARPHWLELARELGIGVRLVLREVEAMATAMPAALDEVAAEQAAAHGESPVIQLVRRVVRRQCRRSLQLLR